MWIYFSSHEKTGKSKTELVFKANIVYIEFIEIQIKIVKFFKNEKLNIVNPSR